MTRAASRDFGTSAQDWSLQDTSALSGFGGGISTVAFWVKISGYDSSGIVFWGWASPSPSRWWQITSAGAVFTHAESFTYSGTIPTNEWVWLAFTHNTTANFQRFYINDTLAGSDTATNTLSTGAKNYMIGRWIGGTSHTLGGKMAHFHADLTKSLGPGELSQLMRYPGSIPTQLYIPMNTGEGPERDLSGNAEHCTVNSATVSTDGPPVCLVRPPGLYAVPAAAVAGGRIMSSLVGGGGLAGHGGIAGQHGGLAA